ncbi:MAG: SNF2-related protein [Desulfobacteraceae bacterium]
MAKSKEEKKKQKRKKKRKQAGVSRSKHATIENGWFHMEEASIFISTGYPKKAVKAIKKALHFLPDEEEVIHSMGTIAQRVKDESLEVDAMDALERIGKLNDEMRVSRVIMRYNLGRYEQCIAEVEKLLEEFTKLKIKNKRDAKKNIKEVENRCRFMLMEQEKERAVKALRATRKLQKNKTETATKTPRPVDAGSQAEQQKQKNKKIVKGPESQAPAPNIQAVPVVCNVDDAPFFEALSEPLPSTPETYELALLSHRIRFADSFESLVCLTSLTQVRSFWYQEETAKKVLKQFRGRALLSDEVGLGKTIEALIILVEYIKRGMVATGVILTPTPLVSQWKEELKLKFNMDVPSTDDPEFQSGSRTFWDNPLVVASINHAKSKKNFDLVTGREYDMIIVDEAHHLKNRSTLNWKLVNSLKKRFILLLTATPVENNLMELYNLITLLKPGQLATAKAFREKFMTRGDPTDPRNQALLKELLNQVMIRNTRALAGIHIPPRFAETIRIEPLESDKVFYQRLEELILSLNEKKQGRAKTMVKNLLAQAGSSPKAVELSLNNMLAKKESLGEHEEEIRAVKNLCRTTVDTPKNMALMKVIKATREKIIVFVKYKGTIDHLAEFLEWNNISFSLFHGSMDNKQKDLSVEEFRDKNQVLVTTEIGGEGRNLQFCSRMVNYDLPWNPMKIEQRIGRIHRIGQENQVQIFNFCATGSIEDYILDVLDRKINMFEMVIGEIDMVLGRVRGEKEFGDMVYDIWVNAENEEERKQSFSSLGTKLKRAKTGYHKTRELDDKLFGDNYEL